ncbi:FUN14 family-domain-containing protein [Amylostereum chailletii]|nr:FUN14 family-domain-containing protein [Amylostereum chailletii]
MASAYLSIFSRTPFVARMPITTLSGTSNRALNISYRQIRHSIPKRQVNATFAWRAAGLASVGLGLSIYSNSKTIYCEPGSAPATPPKHTTSSSGLQPLPPPPPSSVNFYELSFGTVCGICAGVFIKKGAKALAFAFGGVFVLLQYLGSKSIVKVDWGRASSRFERAFYTEANGVRRPPSVGSAWRWLVDFLTADFQPRASFIAGLALGIRIG